MSRYGVSGTEPGTEGINVVSYSNPETLSADDLAGYEALGSTAREAIVSAAKAHAAEYVAEHGHAYDDERTRDWDAQGWGAAEGDLAPEHRTRLDAASEIAGHAIGWAIYAEALHAETERLTDAA